MKVFLFPYETENGWVSIDVDGKVETFELICDEYTLK